MLRLTAIALSLTLLAASADAQNKPMIQKLSDEWAAAFNKGDSHALAELYTEDAYVLPAGGEMVHGRQAVQGFWDNTMKQLGDAKLTTVDVQPLGRIRPAKSAYSASRRREMHCRRSSENTSSSGAKSTISGN